MDDVMSMKVWYGNQLLNLFNKLVLKEKQDTTRFEKEHLSRNLCLII